MNLKKIKNLLVVLVFSAYVLPYPGFMPGNKLYRIKEIYEQICQHWVFGSFARYKYELSLADKKLVEAKILFEYNQYPLAITALSDSNTHFQKAKSYLLLAEKEGKNISQKQNNFKEAAEKHLEVLKSMQSILPTDFNWQPEKKSATELNLKLILEEAIKIREI